MKLRNKKTGEIGYTAVLQSKAIVVMDENAIQLGSYSSLAELNEEWEDYEEPKEYWYVDYEGGILLGETDNSTAEKMMKSIGNYFNTLSEAEKAVEKLKAWKRLKDKGFRIALHGCKDNAWLEANWGNLQGDFSDVLLLFGGEE